ncbi:MAG: hypothetical protein DWI04_04635 [Planctomycetota bacterium]|nr:MAG: hypothetical protein DWI04_04635 [Planctomycetota bacterium]
MGVRQTGAGLLRHRSGRLSERRPQKPLFAIRMDRPPPGDAALVCVLVKIVFQRFQPAFSGDHGRGTGLATATVA